MLQEDDLRDAALLVYSNKQDLPNAMTASEVTEQLQLRSLKSRFWFIQSTCATNGDGLYDGLNWLSNILSKSTYVYQWNTSREQSFTLKMKMG